MSKYIPGRPMAEPTRVWQEKFVTGKQLRRTQWTRSGRAVRKAVPTDFETTYRTFLSISA